MVDPVAGSVEVLGDLITPCADHTATLLPSRYVLFAGGTRDAVLVPLVGHDRIVHARR